MEEAGKIFAFLGLTFLLLSLAFNLMKLPKIPGDILIEKGNFRFYIPWISSLIVSVILTIAFNFFR